MIIIPFTFQLETALTIIAIILIYEFNYINNFIAITSSIFALAFALNPFYLIENLSVITMQKIFFPTVIFQFIILFHLIITFFCGVRLVSGSYERLIPIIKGAFK